MHLGLLGIAPPPLVTHSFRPLPLRFNCTLDMPHSTLPVNFNYTFHYTLIFPTHAHTRYTRKVGAGDLLSPTPSPVGGTRPPAVVVVVSLG